jgi:hypothetical protein
LISYEIQDAAGLSDTATVSLTIQGVRDALQVVSQDATAVEDVPFAFPISVTQIDNNGEQYSGMMLYGLPTGTQVSDISGLTRSVDGSQSINLFGMDLATLTVALPANVSGTIPVVLEVQSTLGVSATQFFTHEIEVEAVADAPVGSAVNVRGQLGQTLPFALFSGASDADGSEIITLGVRGIPLGMRITDGVHSATGFDTPSWIDVTGWQMDQLRLETSGGINAEYELIFRIISTEQSNGSFALTDIGFTLTIDQVLPLVDNPSASNSTSNLEMNNLKVTTLDNDSAVAIVITDIPLGMSQAATVFSFNYIPFENSPLASIVHDEFTYQPLLRGIRTAHTMAENETERVLPSGLPELSSNVVDQWRDNFSSVRNSNPQESMDKWVDHRLVEQATIEKAVVSQEKESFRQSQLAGGILAFWNMLRSHASGLMGGSLSNKESDSIDEQRVVPRGGKRDEDEK